MRKLDLTQSTKHRIRMTRSALQDRAYCHDTNLDFLFQYWYRYLHRIGASLPITARDAVTLLEFVHSICRSKNKTCQFFVKRLKLRLSGEFLWTLTFSVWFTLGRASTWYTADFEKHVEVLHFYHTVGAQLWVSETKTKIQKITL